MKKILIILSTIFLISSSCEKIADHSYTIEIKNNSNQIIDICAAYIVPDTLLPLEKPKLIEIQIGKYEELYDKNVNDPKFVKFKTEKLSVFVLSKDTVDKYSWDMIRTTSKILKRYEIMEIDLINMGGSVVYP